MYNLKGFIYELVYTALNVLFVPVVGIYFWRFSVFSAISMSPSLASLSGKWAMAAMAFSEYSWARARVCSMPSLCRTSSRA
jgi:hypothetical protein